jgi:hypothetical protein
MAPVMYRLLEQNPASPQHSRHSARAAAKVAADRPLGACEGAVETTAAENCWEASDQRRDAKRHFAESGVSCVWRHFSAEIVPLCYACTTKDEYRHTCNEQRKYVVSKLPIKRLKRTTRLGREGSPQN